MIEYIYSNGFENVAHKKYVFQNHDLFKWSDGWRVSYTNWGIEDNTKDEACVQLNITTGKWDAMQCDTTLPYMCKFSTGNCDLRFSRVSNHLII